MTFKIESGRNAGLDEAILTQRRDFLDHDPVGLPDQADIENIQAMIRNFDRAQPGAVQAYAVQARRDREAELDPWFQGYVNKDRTRRRVLTMPTALLREVEEAYPLMFVNRKHLNWFKTHFPMFNSSSR